MYKLEGWGIFRAKNEKIQFFGWILDHPDIPDGPMTTLFVETFDEASQVADAKFDISLGGTEQAFPAVAHRSWSARGHWFDAFNMHNVTLPGWKRFTTVTRRRFLSQPAWLTKSDWNELHPGVPMSPVARIATRGVFAGGIAPHRRTVFARVSAFAAFLHATAQTVEEAAGLKTIGRLFDRAK